MYWYFQQNMCVNIKKNMSSTTHIHRRLAWGPRATAQRAHAWRRHRSYSIVDRTIKLQLMYKLFYHILVDNSELYAVLLHSYGQYHRFLLRKPNNNWQMKFWIFSEFKCVIELLHAWHRMHVPENMNSKKLDDPIYMYMYM